MGIVAIETWLRAGETLHSLTLRRVRIRPELNFGGEPDDAGFVSSLLGNHPDYQLTLVRQDAENASIITLDLTGPAPVAGCREVVNSMRRDARVLSVEVPPDVARPAPPVSAAQATGTLAVSTVQTMGTVQAGPDGDWFSVGRAESRMHSRLGFAISATACFEAHGYFVR